MDKTIEKSPVELKKSKVWSYISWTTIILGTISILLLSFYYFQSGSNLTINLPDAFFISTLFPIWICGILIAQAGQWIILNSRQIKTTKGGNGFKRGIALSSPFLVASILAAWILFSTFGYLIGTGGVWLPFYYLVMTGFVSIVCFIFFLAAATAVIKIIGKVTGLKKRALWAIIFIAVEFLTFGLLGYGLGLGKSSADQLPTKNIEILGISKVDIDKSSNVLTEGLMITIDTKANKLLDGNYMPVTFDVEINGKTTSHKIVLDSIYTKGDTRSFDVEVSAIDLANELSQNGDYKIGKITLRSEVSDPLYGSIMQLTDSKTLDVVGKLDARLLNDTDFTFRLDQSSVDDRDDITKSPARLYGVIASNRSTPGAVELSTDGGNSWPYNDFGELKQTAAGVYDWSVYVPVQDTSGGQDDYMVKARLVDVHGEVINLNKFTSNKSLNFGVSLKDN